MVAKKNIRENFFIVLGAVLTAIVGIWTCIYFTDEDHVPHGGNGSPAGVLEYDIESLDGLTVSGRTAIEYIEALIASGRGEVHIIKEDNGVLSTGYIRTTDDLTSMRDTAHESMCVKPFKRYDCTVFVNEEGILSYVEMAEQ